MECVDEFIKSCTQLILLDLLQYSRSLMTDKSHYDKINGRCGFTVRQSRIRPLRRVSELEEEKRYTYVLHL